MILGGQQQRGPMQYSFVKWRKEGLTGPIPTKLTGLDVPMHTKFKIIIQVPIVLKEMASKKVPLPVNSSKKPHVPTKRTMK